MRKRFIISTVSLIAALALSSCAQSTPTSTSDSPVVATVPASAAPIDTPVPAATLDEPALAVPISRGPNLEATAPSTVSLASGQLQLVEFFRFT